MTSLESYAHKAAKETVVSWLRDAENNGADSSDFCGLRWRSNRYAPNYGVFAEFPILPGGEGAVYGTIWDEMGWEDRPPTFSELVKLGTSPAAIVDIAVFHKGQVSIAVEIVHKHELTAKKLRFLNKTADIWTVLELPTQWVLGQVKAPSFIPLEFWKLGQPR